MADDAKQLTEEQKRENFRALMVKTREGFTEVGEFIFEFSQLEFTIRASIGTSLKLPDELTNILLSLYTFVSLCQVWKAVMLHQHADKQEDIEKIFKDCLALNDQRVHVAHGTWTMGEETLEASNLAKGKRLEVRTHFAEPGKLKSLSRQSQDVMQAMLNFTYGL